MDSKMETEQSISEIHFVSLPEKYSNPQNITCNIVLENYNADDEDWVGIYSTNGVDIECHLARIFIKNASSKTVVDGDEKQFMTFDFSESSQVTKLHGKFLFKYVNLDLEMVAESDTFEICDEKASSESLFSVQTVDSFEDTMLLVNKLSKNSTAEIDDDLKRIESQLIDAKKRLEQQEECSKFLEQQLKKKEEEHDEEQSQREQAEKAVEELGRRIAEQIHVIEEQGQKIESLERHLSRETKLNAALKEDIDGQRAAFEESLIDYDHQKMKVNNYRTELKRFRKTFQEEREIFAERSAKYDEEIVLLKQKNKQKLAESNMKLQEAELSLKELETTLQFEEHKCLSLERKLKTLSKEYESFIEDKDNDINELKSQISELKSVLENEKKSKVKLEKDHEGAIVELEKAMNNEKAKGNSLLLKCEEMKKRATCAEEKSAAMQLKLDRTDQKMHEMEELIKSSKSELELLRKAVSKEDSNIHKVTKSDSQVCKDNKLDTKHSIDFEQRSFNKSGRRNSSQLTTTKSNSKVTEKTTALHESNVSYGSVELGKTNGNSWFTNHGRNTQYNIVNQGKETGRYVHRYSGRRYGQQENSSNNCNVNQKTGSKDYHQAQRPEQQPGQVRQHRNSLLRENSRLRYSVSLLNHNCAILNYTLQQVVNEAEQKLENIYAMYLEKESECATYISQLQGGALVYDGCYAYEYPTGPVCYYDQYSMQGSEYLEGHPVAVNCFQNDAIVTAPYGYYEVYRQNDDTTQQGITGQMQNVQPVYYSPAIPTDFQQT